MLQNSDFESLRENQLGGKITPPPSTHTPRLGLNHAQFSHNCQFPNLAVPSFSFFQALFAVNTLFKKNYAFVNEMTWLTMLTIIARDSF